MTTINTLNVSDEQISKCHRIEHNGVIFYLVENSRGDVDDDGNTIEYTVKYDKAHKCLSCTCPAGNPPSDGRGYLQYAPRMCWHIRAACAHAEAYRQEQAEQSKLNRLINQGVSREVAQCIVYADDHPYEHSEFAIKRDQARCQRQAFSILR